MLREIDLSIPYGRVVGICSLDDREPSALVSLLGQLEQPSSGTVQFPPVTTTQTPSQSAQVAVALADQMLIPEMSIRDNLFVGNSLFARRFRWSRKDQWALASALLEEFSLPRDGKSTCLSFDRAQRLAMAVCRTLLIPANCYLFDLIDAGLTDSLRQVFHRRIRRLADEGKCVVLSGNSIEKLSECCDDLILISNGKVLYVGPAAQHNADLMRCFVANSIPLLRKSVSTAFHSLRSESIRLEPILENARYLVETIASGPQYCFGYVALGAPTRTALSPGFPKSVRRRLIDHASHTAGPTSKDFVVDGRRVRQFVQRNDNGSCCFAAYLEELDKTHQLRTYAWVDAIMQECVEALSISGTEAHALEASRHSKRLDSLGELAGGIAHDLNNSLAAIMNASELLKVENSQRDLDHGIDLVIRAAESAGTMTKKLLSFSRRGMSELKPISIHTVIDDATLILGRSIDKRVVIRQNFAAESPTVMGDTGELQNVFVNLALNSWNAMRESGGAIRIETKNETFESPKQIGKLQVDAGEYVRIRVADTGCGMPTDVQARAFEPFFTLKPEGQGSGLGLATAFGAIAEHKGAISIRSVIDEGTVVSIWLPVESEHAVSRSESSNIASGEGTILVCDDEPSILHSMRRQLELLGYAVMTANNATECIKLYQEHHTKIDLVLLDYVMPDLNGRACFLKLKEISPTVHALLVTGYRHEESLDQLFQDGILGVVTKPYRLAVLAKRVRSAIAESRSNAPK